MSNEKNLGLELVKQNGLHSTERLETEWRELQQQLEADRKYRVRSLGCLAAGLIAAGIFCTGASFFLLAIEYWDYRVDSGVQTPARVTFVEEFVTEALPYIGMGLFGLGVLLVPVWYVATWLARTRAIKVRLAAIEMQLRSMEDKGV